MTTSKYWTSGLAALGLAAGMTITGTAPAAAADYTVCADECDYTTIQDAVDAAAAGDTITVGAGIYAEAVMIDKSLRLHGPNAGVSPNSSDPLTSNADRADEAIMAPPAGATNHAFTVSGTGSDITISGFTVDLKDGVDRQLYLLSSRLVDANVTLTHNHFTNAQVPADGWLMVSGNLGHTSVTATDNRFSNGGVGNGFRVYNSAAAGAGSTTLDLQNNVFVDNQGWALNNSTLDVSTAGIISGNWIGNSGPAQPASTGWGVSQSGFVLAGEFDDFDLSDNTFKNITAVSLNLWETIRGTLTITDNTFDGYDTGAGGAVISVYSQAGGVPGDVSGFNAQGNRFMNAIGDAVAVINKDGAGTLDVSNSQWDEAPAAQMVGPNILFSPWTRIGEDGKETEGREVVDGAVTFADVPGAPTLTVPDGALPAGAYFEYFERTADDPDLPDVAPFNPVGATFFDLTLVADDAVNGDITVCVAAEEGMRLWHAVDGEWKDITANGGGLNSKISVCGTTTHFSPFAIAAAVVTEVPDDGTGGGTGGDEPATGGDEPATGGGTPPESDTPAGGTPAGGGASPGGSNVAGAGELAATGVATESTVGLLTVAGLLAIGGLGLVFTSRRTTMRTR